jgi:hypothetical protein
MSLGRVILGRLCSTAALCSGTHDIFGFGCGAASAATVCWKPELAGFS